MELLDGRRAALDRGGRPEHPQERPMPLPIFLKPKSARFTFEPLGVVGVIAP